MTSPTEQTFNESDIVLARSGYTTIMDLVRLGKTFFLSSANMNNYTWQKKITRGFSTVCRTR
jgi:hypothetical protein